MSDFANNPNLSRRPLPGLAGRLIAPLLAPLLRALRTKGAQRDSRNAEEHSSTVHPLTVYASYMVGDFFMALPALKKLADRVPVRVLCRPDCLEFLIREGIEGIPFANPFFVRPRPGPFLRTWRSAWALRGRLGPVALDLDADPRTAFWLKVAGVEQVVSYRRAFGVLFDRTFPLPEPSVHQADRDMRVVEAWIKSFATSANTPPGRHFTQPGVETAAFSPAPWIVSAWTRKAEKNWPLEKWSLLFDYFVTHNIPFIVLVPPDADARFLDFQRAWEARVKFLRGSLTEIAAVVRHSAGVVATDNFLGHMAGYYGKPVLWINLCSPAEQVEPRGPRTIAATRPSVEEARRAFDALRS